MNLHTNHQPQARVNRARPDWAVDLPGDEPRSFLALDDFVGTEFDRRLHELEHEIEAANDPRS